MSAYTEKGHAPACGSMFRADRLCTCAVGEVERLRAAMQAALDATDADCLCLAEHYEWCWRRILRGALRDA